MEIKDYLNTEIITAMMFAALAVIVITYGIILFCTKKKRMERISKAIETIQAAVDSESESKH